MKRLLSRLSLRERPDAGGWRDRGPSEQHFVPGKKLDLASLAARGDVNGAHHLARYLWALEVLADRPSLKRVLDVACGAGYGSAMLAERFPGATVVGADADPVAVKRARRRYAAPNLEFTTGDLMRWEETIGPGSFDAIVTFDTLEHVPHRELMLKGLVEHLDPEGAVLLSTPCGAWEPTLVPRWPAHRIEYSAPLLYDVLSRYFRTILRPDDLSLPHRDVFERLVEAGIPYVLWMNPVVLSSPIVLRCPFQRPA